MTAPDADDAAATAADVPVGRSSARRTVARERLPFPVLVFAWLAVAFFALPLVGLLARTPWGTVGDVLGRVEVRDALWLSVRTSVAATALSLVFGFLLLDI